MQQSNSHMNVCDAPVYLAIAWNSLSISLTPSPTNAPFQTLAFKRNSCGKLDFLSFFLSFCGISFFVNIFYFRWNQFILQDGNVGLCETIPRQYNLIVKSNFLQNYDMFFFCDGHFPVISFNWVFKALVTRWGFFAMTNLISGHHFFERLPIRAVYASL